MKHPPNQFLDLLPTLLTLGNLLCGFSAILLLAFWGAPSATGAAGGLILAALVFDGLDGAVARRLGLVSRFGAVLDSLADLVSFGLAPGVLMVSLWVATGRGFAVPVAVAAAWLLAATALRLARVTSSPWPSAGAEHFVGLPCGASGLYVASHALLSGVVGRYSASPPLLWLSEWLLYALPAGVVCLGLLMLSGIVYPRPGPLLRRQRWPAQAMAALAATFCVLAAGGYALLAVCVLFIGSPLLPGEGRAAAARGSLPD